MIEYELKLAGSRCAVVEWNPGGSILVFALHGWLDNLASFESLVEFMPDIRLIAVDFPGHGHSEHIPAGRAYHFIEGIYLIDDLVNHFGASPVNLLGHSMGAAVSTLYAASQPEKLAGLVLIESLGPLTASPLESVSLMQKALAQRVALAEKRKPVYPSFEQALTARAEVSQIEASLIKPLVERALTHVEGGYTWRADSRLRVASPLRMAESNLEPVLSAIEAEVLLIEGDKSFIAADGQLQSRKQLFKRIQTKQLAGGHHVHLQQPQATGELIQSFFTSLA